MVIAFFISLFVIALLLLAIFFLLVLMGGHLHDEESWRMELEDEYQEYTKHGNNGNQR